MICVEWAEDHSGLGLM